MPQSTIANILETGKIESLIKEIKDTNSSGNFRNKKYHNQNMYE